MPMVWTIGLNTTLKDGKANTPAKNVKIGKTKDRTAKNKISVIFHRVNRARIFVFECSEFGKEKIGWSPIVKYLVGCLGQ